MTENYCQSCGMPMGTTTEHYGTEAGGEQSLDYCSYCYEKGAFTATCTMDEMIAFCVPHMTTANTGMSEDKARTMMANFFPMLKRWQTTK